MAVLTVKMMAHPKIFASTGAKPSPCVVLFHIWIDRELLPTMLTLLENALLLLSFVSTSPRTVCTSSLPHPGAKNLEGLPTDPTHMLNVGMSSFVVIRTSARAELPSTTLVIAWSNLELFTAELADLGDLLPR